MAPIRRSRSSLRSSPRLDYARSPRVLSGRGALSSRDCRRRHVVMSTERLPNPMASCRAAPPAGSGSPPLSADLCAVSCRSVEAVSLVQCTTGRVGAAASETTAMTEAGRPDTACGRSGLTERPVPRGHQIDWWIRRDGAYGLFASVNAYGYMFRDSEVGRRPTLARGQVHAPYAGSFGGTLERSDCHPA